MSNLPGVSQKETPIHQPASVAQLKAAAEARIAKQLAAQQLVQPVTFLNATAAQWLQRTVWFSVHATLSLASLICMVLAICNIAFNFGVPYEASTPFYVPAWTFLVGFFIACLISAITLCLVYYQLPINNCWITLVLLCTPFYWLIFVSSKQKAEQPNQQLSVLVGLYGLIQIMCQLKPRHEGYSRSPLYYMVLIAIFCAIFLLFNFGFGQFRVFAGWSIQADAIVYLVCLLVIDKTRYGLIFGLIAPWLGLPLASGILNPIQGFVEYILAYYVLLPVLVFPALNQAVLTGCKLTDKKVARNVVTIIFFGVFALLLFSLKAFVHIWAGVVWWVNGDWIGSLALNALIVFGSFGLCVPFAMAAIPAILQLRKAHLIQKLAARTATKKKKGKES